MEELGLYCHASFWGVTDSLLVKDNRGVLRHAPAIALVTVSSAGSSRCLRKKNFVSAGTPRWARHRLSCAYPDSHIKKKLVVGAAQLMVP